MLKDKVDLNHYHAHELCEKRHNVDFSNSLPGLSILRTICAFSILFGHFYQFGRWDVAQTAHVWLPEVYLPVATFFVITGFLMAWGFLHEEERAGDICVAQSYKRRAIRILPLYYIGIAVGLLTLWACKGTFEGNIWGLIFLQPNISHILGTTPFPLWHYWFLGAEVTFFLLFPWLFKLSKKHRLPILIGQASLWLLAKWGSYIVLGKGLVYRYLAATPIDVLLLGSIVAILFYEQRAWLISLCGQVWFALVSWALFLTTQLWVPVLPSPVRSLVIAIISVMVILSGFCGHPVLENKVTQFFSKISYGIYIFHPIVLYACSEGAKRLCCTCEYKWGGYLWLFVVVLITIALSWVMHRLVDKKKT